MNQISPLALQIMQMAYAISQAGILYVTTSYAGSVNTIDVVAFPAVKCDPSTQASMEWMEIIYLDNCMGNDSEQELQAMIHRLEGILSEKEEAA